MQGLGLAELALAQLGEMTTDYSLYNISEKIIAC